MLVDAAAARLVVRLVAVLIGVNAMTDHDDELREAAEAKPSGVERARAFLWKHRTFFAPLVGILAAKLCPLLGWAAGPCAIVGDALRGSLNP